MDTQFSFQPFESGRALVELLTESLRDKRFNNFYAIVAWARPGGLRLLEPALEDFRRNGGTSRTIVGIDQGGSSIEGLDGTRQLFDESFVVHDDHAGIFHPKAYVFTGPAEARVIIGSNNLTAGGLHLNYEISSITDIDTGIPEENAKLESFFEYWADLLDDPTCKELTEELITAIADDASLRVFPEATIRSNSKSASSQNAFGAVRERIFGVSRHVRRRISQLRPAGSESGPSGEFEFHEDPVDEAPSELLARWTKRLTRSDCGRPRQGSNTTAALRFTKAGHPIAQATWFREILFDELDWTDDPSREGRELAVADFDVEILNVSRGVHSLRLKYDALRESDQANFTTDLKWGTLSPVLAENDLVDSWVAVERYSNGSLKLLVTLDEPEFVNNFS